MYPVLVRFQDGARRIVWVQEYADAAFVAINIRDAALVAYTLVGGDYSTASFVNTPRRDI